MCVKIALRRFDLFRPVLLRFDLLRVDLLRFDLLKFDVLRLDLLQLGLLQVSLLRFYSGQVSGSDLIDLVWPVRFYRSCRLEELALYDFI